MLPLPKLSRAVPTEIPYAYIYWGSKYVDIHLGQAANSLVDLGGAKHVKKGWPAGTSIYDVTKDVETTLLKHIRKAVVSEKADRALKKWKRDVDVCHFDDELEILDSSMREPFYQGNEGLHLAVTFELLNYESFGIDFLPVLEKTNKKLFSFIRDFLAAAVSHPRIPMFTQLEIYETIFIDWGRADDIMADDSSETDPVEYLEELNKQNRRFQEYLKMPDFKDADDRIRYYRKVRRQYPLVVSGLKSRYPAIKKMLTDQQQIWIQAGFDMLDAAMRMGDVPVDNMIGLECANVDSSVDISWCFAVHWNHAGDLYEEWVTMLDESFGNMAHPQYYFKIEDESDIKKTRQFIDMAALTMDFFYTAAGLAYEDGGLWKTE